MYQVLKLHCKQLVFFIVSIFLQSFVTAVAQTAAITNTRCGYLINPLGIDDNQPRFTWQMDDAGQNVSQTSYQLFVGTDSLSVLHQKGEAWESGKTSEAINLSTYHGKPLQPFTKYYWAVAVETSNNKQLQSSVASFETGMLSMLNWQGWWISDDKSIDVKPAPYFRKTFSVSKKIVKARAYIAVAGLYELYINGNRIGDHYLDPMFTRFDQRNLYVTYDVTAQLKDGGNAIGIMLGNGWYNFQSKAVWDYERAPWRNRPAFCLDVKITYNDGSVETVSSDKSWKTTLSPILFNSLYTGEHYDARKELSGWNTTNYNDSNWHNVINRKAPSQNIVAQTMQPIRLVDTLHPVSLKQINDTAWLFDIGRNISGITQIKLKGDSSTVVRVIHAERLDKQGNIDQSNVDYFLAEKTRKEDPFGTDIYYLSGKGEEMFKPRFNYKGFQYVEVKSNKPLHLSKEDLVAYFMHSDVPQVGNIQTSSDLINKIFAATNASYLSNLFGYPTDCPQREKNGWTGDAHIASETGLYNFDAITVYEKWLADMRDEQQPNGVLPSIVPTGGWGYEWGNGPDWTSAVAIIPWNVYLFYGDSKILSDNYDNIKRYVDHINYLYPDGLTTWGLGDWAPLKSTTPVEFTSSIYYYTDANILAKAAHVLGRQNDFEVYKALTEKIKNAINKKYLHAERAMYADGNQTEQSTALFWGIIPDSLRQKAAAILADSIAKNNYHLDVGILGAKAVLSALSDNGQAQTAYLLASQKTFPSWGWWIENGATTLYENWNIELQRDLSLNHIMFGEIGAWLYKGIGGIKPDESNPGFKNVLLEPNFVDGLTDFSAEHTGPYGKIISAWKRKGKSIVYKVSIPANAGATIHFPAQKNRTVYYRKKAISNTDRYIVSSGIYEFEIR